MEVAKQICLFYEFNVCIYSGSSRASNTGARHHNASTDGDTRRNLYVLGLPFDLTKSEFADIFAPFGTVTHAVILATVDSSSRRRGFIVMSTNDEARAAMNGLSRTQIRGHVLDVSWAVVQRSRGMWTSRDKRLLIYSLATGFLDGGDRSLMLTSALPSLAMGFDAKASNELLGNPWTISDHPTSKLLVSNLPTLLFTQVSDLQPLFYPFGAIKKLGVLHSLQDAVGRSIAAVVEYFDVSSAQEAKESLQSQPYAGHTIEARYVCDNPPVADSRVETTPQLTSAPCQTAQGRLNPFATPFPDPKYLSVARFEHSQLDFPLRPIPSTPTVTPAFVLNHASHHTSDTIPRWTPTTGLKYAALCCSFNVDNHIFSWNQTRTLPLNRVSQTHSFVTSS
ncbi:hypothetical protein EV401DRAFT_1852574 [Pisolithus croceorrhizus]|nr:hypothetical protein EV401DRAFT_1852574 [Pisolithus croceorrhizus]